MNDYNRNITDQEIRELLAKYMIEQTEDTILTQKLIDMEAKIVFAAEPLIFPSPEREQELISRLGAAFKSKYGFGRWIFKGLGLLTVAAVSALLIGKYYKPAEEKKTPVKAEQVEATKGTEPVKPVRPVITALGTNDIKPSAVEEAEPAVPETLPVPGDAPGPDGNNDMGAFFPAFPREEPVAPPMNTISGKDLSAVDTTFSNIRKLEVEGLYCNISIKAVSGTQVSFKGKISVETQGIKIGKADYRINYSVQDSVLKVWVENKGKTKIVIAGSVHWEGFLNFELPGRTDVVVKNRSGNITAEGLQGKVCDIESNYGDIRASDIGTDINLRSKSGDISLTGIRGNVMSEASYGDQQYSGTQGGLRIRSASGTIRISNHRGNAAINSSYGDISLSDLHGDIKTEAASGDITIKAVQGKICELRSSYGNIKAEAVTADLLLSSKSGDISFRDIQGNIRVESSFGSHNYSDVRGNIKISTKSGDVSLQGVKGKAEVVSSFGDIKVSGLKGDLSAEVKSGDITGRNIELDSALNLNATYGNIRMQLVNDINDLSFDLRSSTGDLKINKGGQKLVSDKGSLLVKKGKILVRGNSSSGSQIYE